MTSIFHSARNFIRLSAGVLAFILLVWYVLPEDQQSTQGFKSAIGKYTDHQAPAQLDVSKGNSENFSLKVVQFVFTQDDFGAGIFKNNKLTRKFLQVRIFERNPFYVYATINAP